MTLLLRSTETILEIALIIVLENNRKSDKNETLTQKLLEKVVQKPKNFSNHSVVEFRQLCVCVF